MQSTTIQLAVRGKPSAFDLSFNNEMCVVASPGCLTFFLLSGSGSPRHVIHYEQPQQIRQIRYQKLGHLAALRGGVVSLWDPSKCLRPLLGFVQSPGWITDLNWNLSNYNILATCSDSGGGISLWDVRSPSYSTMQLSAGRVTTSVDWCPSNQNLLAACSDSNCISVWDIRMTTPNTSSGPSIGVGSKNGSFSTITSASGGIISCHWTANEKIVGGMSTSSKTCPSLVISKDDSSIEWWNISGIRTSTNSTSTTINQLTHTQSSYSSADSTCVAVQRDVDHDGESIVLPAPHGNGIVICKFDDTVVPQCNDSTVMKTKRLESMACSLTAIDAMSNSSCSNPVGRRMDITLHGCPRRKTGRGIGIGVGGGVGLSTHPSEDADLWYAKGQATVLASCFEPILGLKWGVVGRLTPAAQAGFKLHMLTESAALHVLIVPVGALKSGCDDDESDLYLSRVGTALPSSLDIRSGDEGISNKPKYSLKKSLCATTGHVEYQAHNIRQVAGYNSIPFLSGSGGMDVEVPGPVPHPTLLAVPGLGVGPVTSTTTASTGYESDQGYVKARAKADLSAVLQWELLGLEERLQAGFLKGLSVSAIDQHASQVTLEVNQVSFIN